MADTTPTTVEPEPWELKIDCDQKRNKPEKDDKTGQPKAPYTRCQCQQVCAVAEKMNEARNSPNFGPTPGARTTKDYKNTKERYKRAFMKKVKAGKDMESEFIHPCAASEYEKMPKGTNPTTGGAHGAPFNAGHIHEAAWGGDLKNFANLKMMDGRVNQSVSFEAYPGNPTPIKAMDSCNCPDGPGPSDPSGCSLPPKEDPDDPMIDIGGEG